MKLAQAYLQLPLSEDSKPLTTINTHRGFISTTECLLGFPVPQPSSSVYKKPECDCKKRSVYFLHLK